MGSCRRLLERKNIFISNRNAMAGDIDVGGQAGSGALQDSESSGRAASIAQPRKKVERLLGPGIRPIVREDFVLVRGRGMLAQPLELQLGLVPAGNRAAGDQQQKAREQRTGQSANHALANAMRMPRRNRKNERKIEGRD